MKRWYKSRTMWANIITGIVAVTGAMAQFLPMLDNFIEPQMYAYLLAVSSGLNMVLRKVTVKAIG